MTFPSDIGIIDLMLGVPPARENWAKDFGSLVRGGHSNEGLRHGAGYMFKDLPDVDPDIDYIDFLIAEMDKWGIDGGILPVAEYAHAANVCAITGGYVYRGSALPDLDGHYFFADYCKGFVKSISWPASTTIGDWTSILSPGGGISSFGQDARGELYILQLGGLVWRIVPSP